MTPELKIACEVVFQEHKTSGYPVTWNRDAFRGRISTGLTEMAKDTLLRKNIIRYPNPAKKILTTLNPAVSNASSYEEAEDMILNKVPSLVTNIPEVISTQVNPVYANQASTFIRRPAPHRLFAITGINAEIIAHEAKWYMKPAFIYFVWPACAAVVGAAIAYLMGSAYTELVFDLKK